MAGLCVSELSLKALLLLGSIESCPVVRTNRKRDRRTGRVQRRRDVVSTSKEVGIEASKRVHVLSCILGRPRTA